MRYLTGQRQKLQRMFKRYGYEDTPRVLEDHGVAYTQLCTNGRLDIVKVSAMLNSCRAHSGQLKALGAVMNVTNGRGDVCDDPEIEKEVRREQLCGDANARQVAGDHYQTEFQHWDFCAANKLDYFQGQITKYVCRWREKNGVEDLEKALHFLQKYIELNRSN